MIEWLSHFKNRSLDTYGKKYHKISEAYECITWTLGQPLNNLVRYTFKYANHKIFWKTAILMKKGEMNMFDESPCINDILRCSFKLPCAWARTTRTMPCVVAAYNVTFFFIYNLHEDKQFEPYLSRRAVFLIFM